MKIIFELDVSQVMVSVAEIAIQIANEEKIERKTRWCNSILCSRTDLLTNNDILCGTGFGKYNKDNTNCIHEEENDEEKRRKLEFQDLKQIKKKKTNKWNWNGN